MIIEGAWEQLGQFDHVGLVVRSLEKARIHLTAAVGVTEWTDPLDDPVNGVSLQFGRDQSRLVYELLVPLDEASPVWSAMKMRKNLLNHLAYRVADLDASTERLRRLGCLPLGEPRPALAFGGALILFFVTPLDTVIELIEAPTFAHSFRNLDLG